MLHIDNLIGDLEEEQEARIETIEKTYDGVKNEKDEQEKKELESELEQKDNETDEQKEESEE